MKKPTVSLSFQSAFSLVELLVVIAVIAVIAAIAIPNIAGITQNAEIASARRNAQNVASLSAAAIAAGASSATMGTTIQATVDALTAGITVTNGSITNGPFKVSGLPTTTTYQSYLTANTAANGGGVSYKPQ